MSLPPDDERRPDRTSGAGGDNWRGEGPADRADGRTDGHTDSRTDDDSDEPSDTGRPWWRLGWRREEDAREPRLDPAPTTGFTWIDEPRPASAAALSVEPPAAAPPGTDPVVAPAAADPIVAPPPTDPIVAPPPARPLGASTAPDSVGGGSPGGIAGRDEDGLLVLGGTPAPDVRAPSDLPEARVICGECGGSYGPDGYCENCGAKAADPRHHFAVRVSGWLGGVCDRGVRHPGNQDALAIRGGEGPQGRRAAIVVCDGVSTAPHSAEASLRAAGAAAEVLTESHARGVGGVTSALVGALGRRLEAAADAAADAVAQVARDRAGMADAASFAPTHGAPSCTFVAAVVEDDVAVIGNVGDSRAYWLPDAGEPVALTTDDSWASEQMRAGATREEAENSPHTHTITRWLGADSPDHLPVLTPLLIESPGWLVVCSDGLWNYASEPAALQDVVQAATRALADAGDAGEATALAQALVEWAHGQGGHDNVTVGLARLAPGGVPSQAHPQED